MNHTALSCFVLCVTSSFCALPAIAETDNEGFLPFSFENHHVNTALISLYEKEPSIWEVHQLLLVGMCYVAENKLDDAQLIFERLSVQSPTNGLFLCGLGNIYHMQGKIDGAEKLYQKGWYECRNISSLRQLAVVKLQKNDMAGFEALLDDLLAHQNDINDVPKILLAYCLMVEDKGRPVYDNVVRNLSRDSVDNDGGLRDLLEILSKIYKKDPNEEEIISTILACKNISVEEVSTQSKEENEISMPGENNQTIIENKDDKE